MEMRGICMSERVWIMEIWVYIFCAVWIVDRFNDCRKRRV